MQIHLDPVGGVAGDMFIAAVLSAYPELQPKLLESIRGLALPSAVNCRIEAFNDGILAGTRFIVEIETPASVPGHRHTHWSDIRELIQKAHLSSATKGHAIGIFDLLAGAEARVHGIPVENVAFHEVGAVDSIVDIVGAATLIDALSVERWTVSALPLGSGQIETAHGRLPVPAPATALLLEGFAVFDDGILGERVTPTGAAIVRYLCQPGERHHRGGTIGRSGFGLGTRKFPGVSNALRLISLEEKSRNQSGHRELLVIEFEVDDQSAEELATGLDHIRSEAAVFDVIQIPAIGKKGRQTSHVKVLADPAEQEKIITLCFRETTTIGLRFRVTEGVALPRQNEAIRIDGHNVRVKIVQRPGIGATAKAEADDLLLVDKGYSARAELKMKAESQALSSSSVDLRKDDSFEQT
jgi:uncharacterized protein (TIGR00299 family) protein